MIDKQAVTQPTPAPLDAFEIEIGKKMDSGEMITEEMQQDGTMKQTKEYVG
jgi:hypothetical protein